MRIAVILLCLALALPAPAATWFVRPSTGEYGIEDGRSYGTAWDGLNAVVWGTGGVQPGDTLYVCGTFDRSSDGPIRPGIDGASGRVITIRGDYPEDPGYVVGASRTSVWTDNGDGAYYASGIYWPCGDAWEGTPGGSEYLLEPKRSAGEVAATTGSFWWEQATQRLWYHPHGQPTDVFTGWQYAVWNDGHDYITYLNLHLYCSDGRWAGVVHLDRTESATPSTNVTVQGCTIKYGAYAGIVTAKGGDTGIIITGNSIREFTQGVCIGVGCFNTDNIVISKNYLDCGEAGYNEWCDAYFNTDVKSAAIYGWPGDRWVIEENFIDRTAGHGICLWRGTTDSATDISIRYNRIEDVADADRSLPSYGIAIDGANATGYGDAYARLLIAYNTIRNCSGDLAGLEGVGIWLKTGNPAADTDRMRLIGNVLSDCNINFRAVAETTGSRLGYIFQNNISYTPKAGGYHAYIANANVRDPVMSYNCWYPDTSSGNNRFLWRLGVRSNLADFLAAATADGAVASPGSTAANPLFTNPSGGDFTLGSGSPVIDAGTSLGDAWDDALDPDSTWPDAVMTVDQDTCGRGWEIGAYGYPAGGSYTLQVTAANGSVTRSPSKANYTPGETVTLTATPNSGYTFAGWSGDLSGTNNPATVTMDANKSVTANFTADGYTLTINAVNGSVTKTPDKASYAYGEVVTLQAAPNSGYSFSSWSGDASGTANPTTVTMNGNKSVTAAFTAASYTLTINAVNGSATRTPSKSSYAHGEVVTLQAAPNSGYNFSGWSGDASGTANPTTITMNSNKSVTASFTASSYTLTISAVNGSVAKTPSKSGYAYGEAVTLQATPNTGYSFSGWSGDASGTTNPTTITMNGSKSVTASFTAITCTLTINAVNGSVTRTPSKSTYTYGETVTLQAAPNTGYSFTGWSGGVSGTANPATITMNGNKSVTATFTADSYTLTINAVNGSVTKTPSKSGYTYGESVALQAVPNSGYSFSGWSGDASGTANPTTVTMNGSKSVTASFTGGPDRLPPVVGDCSPAPDSIQAPPNSLVILHLRDEGMGVDAASVSLQVNGDTVYTGDANSYPSDFGVCFRSGAKEEYTYTYQQRTDYDDNREIEVTVNARDLAGNVMPERTYSFATEMYSFGHNQSASIDQTSLNQNRPATVSDNRGNIWIVWQAGKVGARHIYAARLLPDSDTYNPTVQLSRSTGDHCDPTVAVDAAGTLYAAWQENARGVWDVYLSTSADGTVWSAPKRIVDPTAPTDPPFNQTGPALAAGRQASHLVAIAWADDRAGNQDIYVARSMDAFTTFAASRITSDGASQSDPAVAIDGQDTIVVLWTDARSGSTDIYGAASSGVAWTNTPVAAGSGNQSQPAVAAASAGSLLYIAWVDDSGGDLDILHATSQGLPADPLAGTDIADDTSSADQQMPVLAVASRAGQSDRVFACWQDSRNVATSGDTDLYFADLSPAVIRTNVLVGDDGANTDQSEVAMGVNRDGYPYVAWSEDAGKTSQIRYCGATYTDLTPLAEKELVTSTGGTVGTPPENIKTLEDVSVVIPAQACPFNATISVRRIRNPQGYATESLRVYDFGPSGLTFSQPVTITIPYPSRGTGKVRAFWFDSAVGAFTDQGVTNVEDVTITPSLHALRFNTTHFTPYLISEEVPGAAGGGGGGGGCSLSAGGQEDVTAYFVPYILAVLVLVGLTLRDKRRARANADERVDRS